VNGTSAITATADATNIVTETNESNNTFASDHHGGHRRDHAVRHVRSRGRHARRRLCRPCSEPHNPVNPAGEASGRQAVSMPVNGTVSWTTREATNTIVARFLDSRWVQRDARCIQRHDSRSARSISSRPMSGCMAAETAPTKGPGTSPRHIYDEANAMLTTTVPVGQHTSGGQHIERGRQPRLYTIGIGHGGCEPQFGNVCDGERIRSDRHPDRHPNRELQHDGGRGIHPGRYLRHEREVAALPEGAGYRGSGAVVHPAVAPQTSTGTDIGFLTSGTAATGSMFRNFCALLATTTPGLMGAGQPFQTFERHEHHAR